MTLTLTEVAEFRLRNFVLGSIQSTTSPSSPEKGIRVFVKDGGCNGYEYGMEVTSQPQPDDLLLEQGKLRVYIDHKSAPLLEGVVIDYIEGLTESGFKFTNPNATDTCGCGKSFKAGDCTPSAVPCS